MVVHTLPSGKMTARVTCLELIPSFQAEQHLAVRAGPASCPVTTPAPLAQCELHSACVASNQTGFCCPNLDGYRMDCCDQEVVTASGTVFGMSVPHGAADLVGASANDTEHNNNVLWVLLVAFLVVLCGCCLIVCGFCSRDSKSRTVKIPDVSDPYATQDPMMESLAGDMEAPSEEASLMSSVNGKPLPFPEAGLPAGKLLPFPDVGLPHQHGRPQYHS